MKHLIISIVSLILYNTSASSQELVDTQLIVRIEHTIKSQYKDWVVFSNGTYLVITADSFTNNLNTLAIGILKEFGNGNGKRLEDSNFVIRVKNIDGWVVDSPFQGLYTYVNTKEFKNDGILEQTDSDIILLAISKRKKDVTNPKIVFSTQ